MKIIKIYYKLHTLPLLMVFCIVLLNACTESADDQQVVDSSASNLAGSVNSSEPKLDNADASKKQILTITAPADIQIVSQSALTHVELGKPIIYSALGSYQYYNDAPRTGFKIGNTTVTWTAIDNNSNSSTATQLITILAGLNGGPGSVGNTPIPVETKQLRIDALPVLEIEATAEYTVPNLQQPIINGGIAPYVITNNVPMSGFREGDYQVLWKVADASGQQVSISQNIRIVSMCDININFFTENVSPVLQNNCVSCHNQNGSQTPFNLAPSSEVNFDKNNFEILTDISKKTDISGQSLLLVKPINASNDHGGGSVLQVDSDEFLSIKNMVARIQSCFTQKPVVVENPVVLLDFEETLRKASIVLAGRIPTVGEIAALNQAADVGVKQQVFLQIIDMMFAEKAFTNNVKTIFNDHLLTNAYSTSTRGLSLRLNSFDNKKYFDNTALTEQGYEKADRNVIRVNASKGIADSTLELIAFVVGNNKPFTEILTADYVMVNPYSATIFSASLPNRPDFAFVYGDVIADKDPNTFIPAQLMDNKQRVIPHAGILSSLPFLARFPSTPTNFNRKRAATIFKLLLNTDIEGLASRTSLDLDNVIGEFPTLEDPQCKACHDVMDPVAGLFKNWNDSGEYRGDYAKWGNTKNPTEMLSPGYSVASNDILPPEYSDRALVWLAGKIAADNRFALAISKIMFEAITGQIGLDDNGMFESLKNTFIASNYNIKELIKAIVLTEYFRVDSVLSHTNITNINELGNANLLSPKQLDSKITSLTDGYVWKSPSNKTLTDLNTYNILYGGIDSLNVITRTQQPTGIMAAIQQRLAYQMSCETVPLDFSKPIAERVYFKFVEINDVPSNAVAVENIKQNIQYLFQFLLGKNYAVDSIEVTEAFNLFNSAISGSVGNDIPGKCSAGLNVSDPIIIDDNFTVRSWMAVLSYLYLDYNYLYQ